MKVKLVAIAKDEAAYLPYWIFHHLHFGFDAIEIHINRTQDNSTDVLDKIIQYYPQVSYRNADWVDYLPEHVRGHMQHSIYAESYARIKSEGEFSHICFLDIDEFWTPRDFVTNIHQCMEGLPEATTVSFGWLNVLNEQDEFAPLAFNLSVEPVFLVKSIISLKADMARMHLHQPKFVQNAKFNGNILSDGVAFKRSSRNYECMHESDINIKRPFFILHRMFRTQVEYVASLSRGEARESGGVFKMTRRGYIKSVPNQQEVILPNSAYQAYIVDYEHFLKEVDLLEQLNLAREFVLKGYSKAIELLEKGPDYFKPNDYAGINKIFSGVDDEKIKLPLKAFEQRVQKALAEKMKTENQSSHQPNPIKKWINSIFK